MKLIKKSSIFLLTATLVFFTGVPVVFGGSGSSGAPWYPDVNAVGRTEYSGNLYITFLDTGRRNIPGGIGYQTENGSYREYVVEVYFILELVPKGPHAEKLYFSGIGKTCEDLFDPSHPDYFPECPAGADDYNDWFYLPGDYLTRVGVALHGFLDETVYPALGCSSTPPNCFLKDASFGEGTGNAEEVVDPAVSIDVPPAPWFWVQPLTIVTP